MDDMGDEINIFNHRTNDTSNGVLSPYVVRFTPSLFSCHLSVGDEHLTCIHVLYYVLLKIGFRCRMCLKYTFCERNEHIKLIKTALEVV